MSRVTTHPPASLRVVTDRQDPDSVERLLTALPDWFGIEESVHEYVADAALKPTYLAEDAGTGEVLGALLVTRHWPETAEIHLLAVDPAHHRKGIGRTLTERFEADMRADGFRLLEVKTQGPSLPDPDYAATLAFYRAMGYLPLEELHGYWPENPCLILVKPLCA